MIDKLFSRMLIKHINKSNKKVRTFNINKNFFHTNYLNFKIKNEYDIPEGVIVLSLIENGPSEEAGLLPFDVIIGMDSQPIHNFDDLSEIVLSKKIGDSLEVEVVRGYKDGEKQTVTITLIVGEKDSTTRR